MGTHVLTALQSILLLILMLWVVGLGFALILQQHGKYFNWTNQTLKSIWTHSWKLLLGIAIGYALGGYPLLRID